MARVPEYKTSQQRGAQDGSALLRNTAGADSFGAGVAKAVQGFGRAVGSVSSAMQYANDLEDKAVVDERVNNFSDYTRERMYNPDTGYLNTAGHDAVVGRVQLEKDFDEIQKNMSGGLTPKQVEMFNRATQARRNQGLDTAIRHASTERRNWLNNTSEARIKTLANDALAFSEEPDKFNVTIAAGLMELEDLGDRNGWPQETLQQRRREYMTSVHSSVVSKYAPKDPLRAKAYLDANKGTMEGDAVSRLDSALAQPVRMAQAASIADAFMTDNTRPPVVNAAGRVDSNLRTGARSPAEEGSAFAKLQDSLGDVLVGGDTPVDGAVSLDVRGLTRSERAEIVTEARNAGYTGIGFSEGKIMLDTGETKRVWGTGGGVPDYAKDSLADFTDDGEPGAPIDVYEATSNISDPLLRREAISQITARQASEDAMLRRQTRNAKIEAEKFIVANPGKDPRTMPLAQQMALGLDGMNSMISYYDRTKAGGNIETDERLYADLERQAAEDPLTFAKEVDLFDYMERLDTVDRRRLQTLQAAALRAQNDAKAKQANDNKSAKLSTAMSIADEALLAAGVKQTGKKANEESRLREARFQRAVVDRFREFQEQNDGRVPNDYEMRDMVDELLLPVVFERPGRLFGTKEREGRLFEAPYREDNETIDIDIDYNDIPVDTRGVIRDEMQTDLGRAPTEDEIKAEYQRVFLAK